MKIVKVVILCLLTFHGFAFSMSLDNLPDELVGNIFGFLQKNDAGNLMQISRRYRDLYQRNNWALHYSVVKNDIDFFKICVAGRSSDSLDFVNGLTCFDLAIIYNRYEFIDLMKELGIVVKNFEFMDKISHLCISIASAANYTHVDSDGFGLGRVLLRRSSSMLDHSGLLSMHNYIKGEIEVLPKCNNIDIVNRYIKIHEGFICCLKRAIKVIKQESDSTAMNTKRTNIMNYSSFDNLLKVLGIEGGIEQVLGGEKLLSTNDLITILQTTSDLLKRRVSVISQKKLS
jgi:hypothetical protein